MCADLSVGYIPRNGIKELKAICIFNFEASAKMPSTELGPLTIRTSYVPSACFTMVALSVLSLDPHH